MRSLFLSCLPALAALLWAVAPLHATPAPPIDPAADTIPGRWLYIPDNMQQLPVDDGWWRGFDDPLLDSLVSEAQRANADITEASHRIELARRGVESARAGYYPTLGVSAGWSLGRSSGNMTSAEMPASRTSYFNLGAQASWEPDLFGRVTAKVRQSRRGVSVSRADYAATMVSVCSAVASSYIQLRMYQAELSVMEGHLASQDSVLRIVRARHEAGLVSELDEAQSLTVYGSTKAQMAPLRTQVAEAVNAIALLLGCYPAEVSARLSAPAPMPRYRATVTTLLPAELLRRRPDIIAAERTLAEQAAAVGVAKKEFLPRLAINGTIGWSSHDLDRMFSHNSLVYSVEPTLSWTAFDGFGRRAAVASAREQMAIASTQYTQTVLAAVSDVENALASFVNARRQESDLQEVTSASALATRLAVENYRSGLTDYTTVANAQISYLTYADAYIQAHARKLLALIALYKAQGGGIPVAD